jgi:putative ABC transport system permease protein
LAQHAEHPFRVVGILAPTGTPVDRTVHVALEGLDLVHAAGTGAGVADPLAAALAARAAREATDHDDHDRAISAILVGLRSRAAVLSVQRAINETTAEPLTALLPGVTLLEVWEVAGVAERALRAVSMLVLAVGLAGLLVALLTSLGERRREMAVLRSVGARPAHVFALILGEAVLVAAAGVLGGFTTLEIALTLGAPWVQAQLGFAVAPSWPKLAECGVMLLVVVAAALAGVWPAWRSYRFSLLDGMTLWI